MIVKKPTLFYRASFYFAWNLRTILEIYQILISFHSLHHRGAVHHFDPLISTIGDKEIRVPDLQKTSI